MSRRQPLHKTTRYALPLEIGLIGLFSACQQDASQADRQRPNIIYIMSDDHALRTIGAYGGIHRTPNLDRLAADGALFLHAFVANSMPTRPIALASGMGPLYTSFST